MIPLLELLALRIRALLSRSDRRRTSMARLGPNGSFAWRPDNLPIMSAPKPFDLSAYMNDAVFMAALRSEMHAWHALTVRPRGWQKALRWIWQCAPR